MNKESYNSLLNIFAHYSQDKISSLWPDYSRWLHLWHLGIVHTTKRSENFSIKNKTCLIFQSRSGGFKCTVPTLLSVFLGIIRFPDNHITIFFQPYKKQHISPWRKHVGRLYTRLTTVKITRFWAEILASLQMHRVWLFLGKNNCECLWTSANICLNVDKDTTVFLWD